MVRDTRYNELNALEQPQRVSVRTVLGGAEARGVLTAGIQHRIDRERANGYESDVPFEL